ncbi:sulfate/molybdate ABC transporter ATP-binding protein [Petroclostridium sp. X23]|uniref:sulfate/molybdate ABC transporter ATP-binding protein n=1 Tax=Petroclostridium sp. X23 TaxID=3045146 RepID=UPI0024AD12DC|nr:sulfate/molybdate ABC transporter ATP-binding protein [Petroclostridium sp. X23]WHH57692.1 sulfate/molybdate ABC transporter ATP-binding protein [Petroclostridium sp. X23]
MDLLVDIQKKLHGFTLEASFRTRNAPLALLGASGSGKSMTLRCIAGLETPTKGRIELDGRVLFDSDKGINLPCRKRKIGFLFQNFALFPHMTVAQNIAFGLHGLTKSEQTRIIKEKIAMMQLEGLEHRYPSQMSGGQQQRVALARALAVEPEVLLLDEPFSALDNHLRSQMERQLIEILSEYQGTTLFVTHNMAEAYRVCKDIVIFSQGKIVADGEKESIFHKPPSYDAAQLTGCKNISEARKISDHLVEAVDWGCVLHTDEPVGDSVKYVGIRAHYLEFTEHSDKHNTFECWVTRVSEAPFEVTVYLSLTHAVDRTKKYHLQWEVSKERWEKIKNIETLWRVSIDPKKLFLIL